MYTKLISAWSVISFNYIRKFAWHYFGLLPSRSIVDDRQKKGKKGEKPQMQQCVFACVWNKRKNVISKNNILLWANYREKEINIPSK